jgi:hypothetical protein
VTAVEQLAIRSIESYHMTEQRQKVYIALEELNFIWDFRQVRELDEMWRRGFSLQYMAEYFDRDPDEVAILLMDRLRRGRIRPRKGGIFGGS